MAVNLKTQVAIEVDLKAEFKEARDIQLAANAAVAFKDGIEDLGRAFIQTTKGYKEHIKQLTSIRDNLILGSDEYKKTEQQIANTTRRLTVQTEAIKANANALAMVQVNNATTTEEYAKQIPVIEKAIKAVEEYNVALYTDAMSTNAGEDPESLLAITDAMEEQEALLNKLNSLRQIAINIIQEETAAVNVNKNAQTVLSNSYRATVNGITAQKNALLEVFKELEKNKAQSIEIEVDADFINVAKAIQKLDDELEEFNKYLQKTYTSSEAYSKALELMKTQTVNTTNEINNQKKALGELLSFINIASDEYSNVNKEIQRLTQSQQQLNNKFLNSSTNIKQFLGQFEKDKTNIFAITDIQELKAIIDAVNVLSEGVSKTSSNYGKLQTILAQANAAMLTLGNTTQNTNSKINATLANIKEGLTGKLIQPVDFLDKFKNIEQVNIAITQLQGLLNISNFRQSFGSVTPTKPNDVNEIKNLINTLAELKQIMEDLNKAKPFNLTDELERLEKKVPTTIASVNQLLNEYAQLINNLSVKKGDNKLFAIDEEEHDNIRQIQVEMEKASYQAANLKNQLMSIFTDTSSKQSGLQALLEFADKATSVNEMQEAISKLKSTLNNMDVHNLDKTGETFIQIIDKIKLLELNIETVQSLFTEFGSADYFSRNIASLEKFANAMSNTVQQTELYANTLNKINKLQVQQQFAQIEKLDQKYKADAVTEALQLIPSKFEDFNLAQLQQYLQLLQNMQKYVMNGTDEFELLALAINDVNKALEKQQATNNEQTINGMQEAISKLKSSLNNMDVNNLEKTNDAFRSTTEEIELLQFQLDKAQLALIEFGSADYFSRNIASLEKFANTVSDTNRQTALYKDTLNEINRLQVQQQFAQIENQDKKYKADAVNEALALQPDQFEDFNLAQLQQYLQLLQNLQKYVTNNEHDFNKLAGRINDVNEALAKQEAVGKSTLSFWEQLKNRLTGVNTELDDLELSSEEFLQTLEMVYYQFDNFLTRGISDSIKQFASVQAEILRVTATVGNATEKEMTKVARAATMSASATQSEVANIMLIGARAGLDKNEVQQYIQPIIAGMEATGTSAETMASTVIDSLRSFRRPFEDTNEIVDLLTQVANKSNQEISDLAESLRYTAPYASALQVDITDLSAVLAILANAGIKGSEAGTGLRMALNRLAIAANATSGESLGLTENQERLFKIMKQLGTEIRDQNGNLIPLVEILIKLRNVTEDYSSTQRAELVTALFGIEAAGKLTAALNLTEAELRLTAAQIANNTGVAKQLQSEIQGTDYKFRQFSNALELFNNSIGKAFADLLTPFITTLTMLLNVFNSLPAGVRDFIGSIVALIAQFIAITAAVAAYNIAKVQLKASFLIFASAARQVLVPLIALKNVFVQLLVARVPGFVTSVTTAFRGLTAAIYGTNVAANVASSGGLARLALLGGKFALAAATLASTFVVLEKATKLFQPDEFFDQERSKQLFPSSDTERDTIYTEINKKLDELKKTNQINEKAKAEIQKKIETDKKLLNAIKENNKKSVEALTANYRPLEPTLQIIKDRSKVLEMIAKLIKMDETTSFDVKDKENLKVNITAALKEFGINNNNITKAISAFIEDQNPANKKSLLTALVEITDQQKSKIGETIKLQEEIIKKFDNLSTDVPATPVTEVSTEVAKALQLIDEATATAAKEKATAIRNAEKQIIQIEQNAINELKKINIDAADSIAKYKKENIEKLANFTIQKEREIQEAKKQIQKNDLNILRNQQDYESSMQMISRRLKGFSTIDLEYEYKLRRLLEDKNQSLEDIRYTRIKDVKDLEQEIINIRKEGEKEVYNIWYDLYTRRTQIINDANAGRLQVGQDLRYSLQEIDRNKNERIIESLQSQNQQSSNILTLDDTFYKPPDITKLLQLAGLNRSQFEMYRQVLGARESGGIEKPYEAVNQFGYMGAYQIGRDVYNDAMVFAKQNKIHTEGINPK